MACGPLVLKANTCFVLLPVTLLNGILVAYSFEQGCELIETFDEFRCDSSEDIINNLRFIMC